jgi:hypothetical protein
MSCWVPDSELCDRRRDRLVGLSPSPTQAGRLLLASVILKFAYKYLYWQSMVTRSCCYTTAATPSRDSVVNESSFPARPGRRATGVPRAPAQ